MRSITYQQYAIPVPGWDRLPVDEFPKFDIRRFPVGTMLNSCRHGTEEALT